MVNLFNVGHQEERANKNTNWLTTTRTTSAQRRRRAYQHECVCCARDANKLRSSPSRLLLRQAGKPAGRPLSAANSSSLALLSHPSVLRVGI
jgi:hypothetical protein